jgi:hypothetical protein
MKSQIFFIAMGIVVSTTALGFATVGQPPAPQPYKTTPVLITDSAAANKPRRIYCYNGTKGEPGSLYRGWVCELEQAAPALSN